MKKIFFLLLLFVILVIMAILIKKTNILSHQNQYKDFRTINYQLSTTNYKLLVADTPEKWERGLMFFRKLKGVDGMIFLFPDKQPRTFWNKNTFIDLELSWINDDKIVGKSFLPSIEKSKEIVTVNSPSAVNKVIELLKLTNKEPAN